MTKVASIDVAVIGLGYIGLPTAAVIARSGKRVVGVDIDASIVAKINNGGIHIEEPDLDAAVRSIVADGRLSASLDVPEAETFIIAVPTPSDEDHRPDITYVLEAARAIGPVLKPGNLVILESTSPIGTTDRVRDLIAELRPDLRLPKTGIDDSNDDICVAYCPERVLPGRILIELVENDRCIGGIGMRCAERAAAFYRQFVRGDCIPMGARAAEMVKLAENSFRDVNIAFANELSLIADANDIDVWEVIRVANRHPRVNILQPGPGVGGHCIAVDPWFLVHSAPEMAKLIRTARQVNDGKSDYVIERCRAMIAAQPEAKIACLGLAFKPNVDDFRESPALRIAAELAAEFGERIMIVEPYAQSLPDEFENSGAALSDLHAALSQCSIVILLVDHGDFRSIGAGTLVGKTVYDTRGCLPVVS
jgi:UDP-N-acetyl-D-mannosaminuronic acid dehydrogenase